MAAVVVVVVDGANEADGNGFMVVVMYAGEAYGCGGINAWWGGAAAGWCCWSWS